MEKAPSNFEGAFFMWTLFLIFFITFFTHKPLFFVFK